MSSLVDYFSLLAIVIIGIPHGALDLDLAIAGNSAPNRKTNTIFFAYVVIAFWSLVAWYLIPTVALVTFLLLSAIHFGRANPLLLNHKDKTGIAPLIGSIIFQGGLTTVFLPWIYWNEIKDIFDALGAKTDTFQIIGSFVVPLWGASVLMTMLNYRSAQLYIAIASLIGIIYFKNIFTPLFLFSIFFCLLHSIPHYFKASSEIGTSPKKPPLTFLINTVSAWAIVATVLMFFYQNQNFSLSTLNAIFSVLFALTVPHMILVDLLLPNRLTKWRIT